LELTKTRKQEVVKTGTLNRLTRRTTMQEPSLTQTTKEKLQTARRVMTISRQLRKKTINRGSIQFLKTK